MVIYSENISCQDLTRLEMLYTILQKLDARLPRNLTIFRAQIRAQVEDDVNKSAKFAVDQGFRIRFNLPQWENHFWYLKDQSRDLFNVVSLIYNVYLQYRQQM